MSDRNETTAPMTPALESAMRAIDYSQVTDRAMRHPGLSTATAPAIVPSRPPRPETRVAEDLDADRY